MLMHFWKTWIHENKVSHLVNNSKSDSQKRNATSLNRSATWLMSNQLGVEHLLQRNATKRGNKGLAWRGGENGLLFYL